MPSRDATMASALIELLIGVLRAAMGIARHGDVPIAAAGIRSAGSPDDVRNRNREDPD
jgi:hypothetical protein